MQRQGRKAATLELRGAVQDFLAEHEYGSSPKTLALYRDTVQRAFAGWMAGHGVVHLEDLSSSLCREYLKAQQTGANGKPLANSTFLQRFDTAKRFLGWCVEN